MECQQAQDSSILMSNDHHHFSLLLHRFQATGFLSYSSQQAAMVRAKIENQMV
jgi:hypothetical protein